MPLVTCVIPSFNYARYLRIAVDSALAQTHRPMEVIVVDDGSTDESGDILQSYGDRIRAFRQENRGVSVARNRGISEARGDFVGFLDADDRWHPAKIERQLALMADPEVGLVHCWVREVDVDGNAVREVRGGTAGWLLERHALIESTVLGGGSGALVRRACFDELGAFDPVLSTSADWDMWRRIMTKYKVDLVREPLIDYRSHPSAMHRNIALFEHDMMHAFDSMFADPAAAAARAHKARSYATLYAILAGDYYLSGKRRLAARYAVKSVALDPRFLPERLLRKLRSGLKARRTGRRPEPVAPTL